MASKLSLFLAELKRRKVYRVAAIYAAVGVAISLGIPDLFGALLLPDWAARLVIVLLAIGFPVALVLAWAYDLRPEEPRSADLDEAKGAAAVEILPPPTDSEEGRRSVAVLPFVDMSADQDQEYFCDGMAEELINALTKVKGLRVAARTSSFHFKGRSEDVREIGKTLDVGAVLEGSVRRAENRLRVTAQLVSVKDGFHLWSENYDRELEDVFVIQDEISRSIVETLRPTLLGQHERELVVPPTRSLEAYDDYLKGRHYWEGRYEKGIVTALHYFEKAVEIDPDYVLPYTGIADTYNILGLYGYMEPDQAREKARVVAERAVELDDGLSEAHASLGLFHLFLDWDWEKGEAELKRAIQLNPDNARAHAWLALLYGCQNRSAEALEEIDIAERIDPLSNYIASYRAVLQVYARDFGAAEETFERILARDPSYLLAVWLAGWLYYLIPRHEDAQRMGERAVALSNGALFFKSWLGSAYGQAGMHDKAQEVLDELHACKGAQYVSPLWIAWIHRSLGEMDRTFSLVAEALAESTSYLFSIHADPAYDSVRSDPRFIKIASQVGSGVVERNPEATDHV